jgi:DNA-binding winged helix-turn-helix (wHTH) protein
MKVIFINDDNTSKEKILEFLSKEKTVKEDNDSEKIYSFNSDYNIDEFLNQLNIQKENLERIKDADDNEVIIIIGRDSNLSTDHASDKANSASDVLEYKNLKLATDKEEVYFNDKRIKVTALEYKLLLFFLSNPKKLITKNMIIEYIWCKNNTGQDFQDCLYTHIKNLKKKLANAGAGIFIHPVYGQGYKLGDEQDA